MSDCKLTWFKELYIPGHQEEWCEAISIPAIDVQDFTLSLLKKKIVAW